MGDSGRCCQISNNTVVMITTTGPRISPAGPNSIKLSKIAMNATSV